MKYKAQLKYRSFKVHLKELKPVQATMSEGKLFHNLTVDIKYEEENEIVLARGCNNCLLWLILKLGFG